MKTVVYMFILSLIYLSAQAQIPSDSLVAYYPFNGNANDESATGNHASVINANLSTNRFGKPQSCYSFNGYDQYIEFPDHNSQSISTTGKLSISVWMRPDTLDFPSVENGEYVHWMGKGTSGQQEWVLRMYSLNSSRPNRMSCYAFNLSGGLGSGSYVQETVVKGEWVHLTAIYDFPTNTIKLYKNGELKDMDAFTDYSITPQNGTAPFRVGTRDFSSYFRGAIDDIRIYNRVLTDAEIIALYQETGNNEITGITTNRNSKLISICPNPFSFSTTLHAETLLNNATLTIYNAFGQQITQLKNISGQSETLFRNNLPIGVYFLCLSEDNKIIATEKLVIAE